MKLSTPTTTAMLSILSGSDDLYQRGCDLSAAQNRAIFVVQDTATGQVFLSRDPSCKEFILRVCRP